MIKLLNVLKSFSWFIFLTVLLFVYAYLNETVVLAFDRDGLPNQFMQKESLFFLAIGLFVAINLLLLLLKRTLDQTPVKEELQLENPSLALEVIAFSTANYKENLLGWLVSFNAVLNLFLSLVVGYIGVINNQESVRPDYLNFVPYVGLVAIFIWLGILVFLYAGRKSQKED